MMELSRTAVLRKRLQLDSKTYLTRNELILKFFCWSVPLFVDFSSARTEICENCSIFIPFDDIKSFR